MLCSDPLIEASSRLGDDNDSKSSREDAGTTEDGKDWECRTKTHYSLTDLRLKVICLI